MNQILTIAGSDSGGGAGIQADLKTITMLGAYGASVITAITAQNTQGVQSIEEVSLAMIAEQIDAVCADLNIQAVKIGMLANGQITTLVAEKLKLHRLPHVVVDPVMVATSGDLLLAQEALGALQQQLLPCAELVTPNLREAEILAEMKITSLEEMEQAAQYIAETCHCKAVLVKGGHLPNEATDVLFDGKGYHHFTASRVLTENSHGTGCTLSSAVAVYLGQGLPLIDAVREAKIYLTKALQAGKNLQIGHGHGPVLHNFILQ